jgi:transglutaminase-like putative cysteine protease
MRAVAEEASIARRLDVVDVFRLTRVELPRAPGALLRRGELKLLVNGLDPKFQKSGTRQSFKTLTNGQVEVTLREVAPSQKRTPLPLKDPGGGNYLKSTLAVEAEHPEIRAAAKKVVGGEKDPFLAAKAIALWVSSHVVDDYGASSDRASDVLRRKRGDCTEHSLLAVSMMRAAGIPSRRVDGVAYVDNGTGVHALYWHEWVEIWTGAEWIQLDPTFGQPVADASHFAVGEEGSAEITPLIGALKVLDVR